MLLGYDATTDGYYPWAGNGTSSLAKGTADNNPTLITALYDGTSSDLWQDGSNLGVTPASPNSNDLTGLVVAGAYSGVGYYPILSTEFIFYDSDKTSDRASIESNISTYWTPTYLLDSYGADAEAAYSLRKLNRGAVRAIRIREDSGNTETDIGFVGEDLDTAAIASHCGANNGYVVKIYAQDGSGRDFEQSTAASQAQIYNGSSVLTDNNGNYAMLFDGSDDYYSVPSSTSTFNFVHDGSEAYLAWVGSFGVSSNPDSVYVAMGNGGVASADIGFAIEFDDRSSVPRNERVRHLTTQGVNGSYTVDNLSSDGACSPNTPVIFSLQTDSDNGTAANRSYIRINSGTAIQNNSLTNSASASNASYNLNLGRSELPLGYFNGYFNEALLYSALKTSERVAIESNAMDYWLPYLLDRYGADAEAAYSLRQLKSTATNAIRVREDSGNTETDIGFDANGDLDVAAIASHCGANNGYVVTWYDQSGNSNDLTQSTASAQPQIYNGSAVLTDSNGNYAITPDNSDDTLEVADMITGSTNRTDFVLGEHGTATYRTFLTNQSDTTQGRAWSVLVDLSDKLRAATASSYALGNTVLTDSTVHVHTAMLDGSQVQDIDLWVDGTAQSETYSNGTVTLNTGNGGGTLNVPKASEGDLTLTELIRYSAAKTTDRAAIESNISNYWTI